MSLRTPPSTRALDALPSPERLRVLTATLAWIDAILCAGDVEFTTYRFQPAWGDGESLASMVTESGDEWFLWFGPKGLVLLGFDHEASPMTPYAREDHSLWPGLLEGLPEALSYPIDEPAFTPEDLTFCIWRLATDDAYHVGRIEFPEREAVEPFRSDPDGSRALLALLADDPDAFLAWVREAYERDLEPDVVRRVFAGVAIDAAIVRAIDPNADVDDALERAREYDLPLADGPGVARA